VQAALKDGKLTTMEVVSYVGHYFQLTYHFPNPAARRTQLNDLTPSQRISVGGMTEHLDVLAPN
jgi:hypothetical protein